MDRRQFLKSLGALGLTPLVPAPAMALAPAPAVAVSASSYKWAEAIVRSHSTVNFGMVERLLGLDTKAAAALKSQLVENGVMSAARTAHGMHTAAKPLYQELLPRSKSVIDNAGEKLQEVLDQPVEEETSIAEVDDHDIRHSDEGTLTVSDSLDDDSNGVPESDADSPENISPEISK